MVLSGFRGSLTTLEASVWYQHSHLKINYEKSDFCLGESDLKKQLNEIKTNQPNEQVINYLKLLLDAYVAHESLEGTPYITAKTIYEKQKCVFDILYFNISDNLLSLPYTLTLIESVWVKVIPNEVTDKLFQSNDFCKDVFNRQLADVDGSVKLNTSNIKQFTNRKMGYFKDKPIIMQITSDTVNKITQLHKVYQNHFLIELEKQINLKLWKNQQLT
jgi:CRISPR/Cas system-associated protein endoribonuclease Cas2